MAALDGCEIMEVDLYDVIPGFGSKAIPNLPSFAKPETPSALGSGGISFFKQEPFDVQAHHQSQARRSQQTHQPVCPEDFSGPIDADNGACAPSTDGFEHIGLPSPIAGRQFRLDPPAAPALFFLPVEDVDRELATLYAPSVPEVCDAQALRITIGHQPARRQRRDTITLVRDAQEARTPPTGSGSPSFDSHDSDVMIHELMDDADDEHIPVPSSRATNSELRMYDRSASYIMEMHQDMMQRHDLPHAKKKPMLHEFLGYILFSKDPRLEELRESLYLCQENGCRLLSGHVARHFRVANFQNISEVWRKIKCNSSQDCMKNMKRAMRMSTTNERRYFEGLPQRSHRQQVFLFGERSVEHFRKVFPGFYA